MALPLINGHRYSYASIKIIAAGRMFRDVTSISYSHSLEPGIVRGTSASVRGRTRGEYTAQGSFTMLKSTYQQLVNAFNHGYMEHSFEILVSYADRGEPIVTDRLIGCRITNDEDSHSQGSEALVVNVTLSVIRIRRNGISALA